MDKLKITVAITGLNNTDNPGPGIPVIRGLKDSELLDVKVIGLAYENLEPGIHMHDHVDVSYMIPYPSSGTEAYLNRILEIHQEEHIDLIIPNLDAELYTFIKLESILQKHNIKTYLPSFQQLDERNKGNLENYGKKYNINVPKGTTITSYHEINHLKEEFDYPILVKGKFYDAYVAYSKEEVISHFNKISAKWGLPVIIQEYVKGTEVNVVALGDGKGNTIAAIPMRKQYITDKGKAWGGVTLNDDKLLTITRNLIKDSAWKGGMELEMIRTNDDKYYLIEINPRIPAWVYLAVGAGQNIPEALALLAMGKEVKPMFNYEIGKIFIRYSYDLIGDMADLEKISIQGKI
ncbi:ATP-grasp domain-containing protein [Plebeiibacterium marinum]|uniref:ATP-grasp domain-containing protein n=1 Tax=Plebeiibacterium marinum TaxID=2992111 RepID=A0AAE3MAB7_9BACT|nr:ATP-grasp domain-containing protein [Plebeiobacterium marinum]MCW3804028.1 ATP-grasp domain-containing protein [Plebeiobacterium marinum]